MKLTKLGICGIISLLSYTAMVVFSPLVKEWSELNGVEITPEMINCVGCRLTGVKMPFCQSLCQIRQCALGRKVITCGDCNEMTACSKLSDIISNNPDARRRLEGK